MLAKSLNFSEYVRPHSRVCAAFDCDTHSDVWVCVGSGEMSVVCA